MVEKFTFDKLTWAASAPPETTLTFAGDPRRNQARDYLRNAVVMAYEKNHIPELWPAIVVSRRVANSLSMINQNAYAAGIGGLTQDQIEARDEGDTVGSYYVYKIVNVLNNPLPYPMDACDPILLHYPDIQAASSINEAIPLGSFVKITYEDPDHLRGGIITEVGGTIEIGFGNREASLKALWLDAATSGLTNWDSRQTQQVVEWQGADTEGIPAGTELRNGEIPAEILETFQGAKLIKPAMADFKRLVAAYEARFPGQKLKGGGYRPYADQVAVRVVREEGDHCPQNKPRHAGGAGQYNKSCQFVGFAAVPGTSNHGWGAAVDLIGDRWRDRSHPTWTSAKLADPAKYGTPAPDNEYFRWMNQHGMDYNFVFGVRNEHWHIDWMNFSSKVTGNAHATRQTSWTTSTPIPKDAPT